ncbi:SDR family oxidoreductase [Microbispora rosea]|uniref:SDR family oxidoreductase n=1 Tax=Microbispora rosea TaxID=58117 RepID=UPI003D8B007E
MSIITFAVAGATGRLGRHVVDVLAERGHRVVPMSRATGVDITAGEGLAEAVTGVEVVIDVASWRSSEQEAATEFFRTSARNLHEAGRKAGVARIAMASIIGADKATADFLAAKKVHEELLLSAWRRRHSSSAPVEASRSSASTGQACPGTGRIGGRHEHGSPEWCRVRPGRRDSPRAGLARALAPGLLRRVTLR